MIRSLEPLILRKELEDGRLGEGDADDTLEGEESGAMRRANQTMPRTQMDVAMDSMTARAVAVRESLYLRGHSTEPRVQTRMLRMSLAGRIWKTMTQINCGGGIFSSGGKQGCGGFKGGLL